MNKLEHAFDLCKQGKFVEAREALEEAILDDPKNPTVLYNLGMCYTEIGKFDAAVNTLRQSIQHQSDDSNAFVALGYALAKLDNNDEAKQYFNKALAIDPNNSFALRNLGGLEAKVKDFIPALQHLKKAFEINPNDPNTNYGLGLLYLELGDISNADKHFKKVVELNTPANIVDLAKDKLREIAVQNVKAQGFRTDAMFYCLGALRKYATMLPEQVRTIAFEIALKGNEGLDINNPDNRYTLKSLPGSYSGLQLVSYMYVGFKQIAPEQDVGIDLSAEYNMALEIFNKGEKL